MPCGLEILQPVHTRCVGSLPCKPGLLRRFPVNVTHQSTCSLGTSSSIPREREREVVQAAPALGSALWPPVILVESIPPGEMLASHPPGEEPRRGKAFKPSAADWLSPRERGREPNADTLFPLLVGTLPLKSPFRNCSQGGNPPIVLLKALSYQFPQLNSWEITWMLLKPL